MKQIIKIFFISTLSIVLITGCKKTPEMKLVEESETEQELSVQDSPDSAAVNVTMDFLRWYSKAIKQTETMILYSYGTEKHPENYRIDKAQTERYLSIIQSSGLVSNAYLDSMRNYFANVDIALIADPENEGPCPGLDFDLIIGGQDYEEGFELDKAIIENTQVDGSKAEVTIKLHIGQVQHYYLSKDNDKWLIDCIKNEE